MSSVHNTAHSYQSSLPDGERVVWLDRQSHQVVFVVFMSFELININFFFQLPTTAQ